MQEKEKIVFNKEFIIPWFQKKWVDSPAMNAPDKCLTYNDWRQGNFQNPFILALIKTSAHFHIGD